MIAAASATPDPSDFHETFINTGHVDIHRAMKTYHDAGYERFFIADHVPHMRQDTAWGHRGRAFANGYIQAKIAAVTKQGAGLQGAAPLAGAAIRLRPDADCPASDPGSRA